MCGISFLCIAKPHYNNVGFFPCMDLLQHKTMPCCNNVLDAQVSFFLQQHNTMPCCNNTLGAEVSFFLQQNNVALQLHTQRLLLIW
jgi:hypothetical protein